MTDMMFTRTALTEAAKKAGVATDQARTILEAAGVKVQPEKAPLPTEPGSAIIATEVRGVKGRWRMMLDRKGVWFSAEMIGGYHWHYPGDITKWIEAVVVPATSAPVTLTEDQVGEVWSKESGLLVEWSVLGSRNQEAVTATVNAALAQHATPAEQCLRLCQECYGDLAVDHELCQGCLDGAGTCEDCERKEYDCRC